MPNVAVIGGTGFLGARTLAALTRAGVPAQAVSRRSAVRVDARDPATFHALDPFDVIVDVTDTVSNPPDAWIAHCLERGATVVEATSEAPCVERLHRAHAQGARGLLVLGGGIFTGVSNLLAHDAADAVGGAERVRLGIASSPFSGAGLGTIELMLRAMRLPSVRFERGERIEREGMARGPVVDFGDARRGTGLMSLAEPYMLRHSLDASDVEVLFAPKPGWLLPAFVSMPTWLVRTRLYEHAMRAYFVGLRRFVLARVAGRVELVAEASRGDATVRRFARSADGMAAAGFALAAVTEQVATRTTRTGACFVDELCTLGAIVERTNRWAGSTLLEISGT